MATSTTPALVRQRTALKLLSLLIDMILPDHLALVKLRCCDSNSSVSLSQPPRVLGLAADLAGCLVEHGGHVSDVGDVRPGPHPLSDVPAGIASDRLSDQLPLIVR